MDEQVAAGHFQLAVQPVGVADEHDSHDWVPADGSALLRFFSIQLATSVREGLADNTVNPPPELLFQLPSVHRQADCRNVLAQGPRPVAPYVPPGPAAAPPRPRRRLVHVLSAEAPAPQQAAEQDVKVGPADVLGHRRGLILGGRVVRQPDLLLDEAARLVAQCPLEAVQWAAACAERLLSPFALLRLELPAPLFPVREEPRTL